MMKIAYYLPDLKNPFWNEITQGVKEEAGQMNHSLKTFSADDQSEKQIAQLMDYETERPGAVLISPIDIDKVAQICRKIMQNNIPMVAIDQHMIHNVNSSIISGNLTGGIMAAKYIGEKSSEMKSIVHIKAPSGYENATLRRKSFISETERQNNLIVKTVEGGCDREITKAQMRQCLNENIQFNAIFAENDVMALGAIDALKEKNYAPWPLVVGFDGIPEAIRAIENHEMSATVKQNPFAMGKKAVELVDRISRGLEYEEVVNISTRLVTAENS
jgi:ribose transport system substrate-binding protein